MNRDDYSDKGAYISGFFCIILDTNIVECERSSDLPCSVQKTFIHEYIHFLQDVSTTSGVFNANFLHQRFQKYLNEAALCDEVINVDINLRTDNIATKQRDLNEYYDGDAEYKIEQDISDIHQDDYEFKDFLPEGNDYKAVYIYNKNGETYLFGRKCILESMAYLIEHMIAGEKQRINELPYNACEMVCQKYCPRLLDQKGILIGVCELSLMHYNSGVLFFEIIRDIEERDIRFNCLREFSEEYLPKFDYLWENYKKQVEAFCKTIDILYADPSKLLGDLSGYLKCLLRKALAKRCKNNEDALFISKLIEKPHILEEYIKLFDIPIINGRDVSATGENNSILYMKIPYAVFRVLTTSNNECILLNDCKYAKQSQIDSSCCNAPWKQSEKKDAICPFGAFWYRFALEGKRK